MLLVKKLPANAGGIRDVGLIPESGRSPGERHSNPLQYSSLENPRDRVWQATFHKVTKSQTLLDRADNLVNGTLTRVVRTEDLME